MPTLRLAPTIDLNYACQLSEGVPLLMFNGASLPLQFWDPVVQHLRHSGVIRFDQRNAGGSSFEGSFSLLDVAADALALLVSLGVDRVVVVGHAWGGRVAQVFARDYPHLVSGMIICGCGGALPPTTDPAVLKSLGTAMRGADRGAWEDALESTFCGRGFRSAAPERFAAISDLIWNHPAHGSARWDMRIAPSASYWGMARVPALLIYGDEDKNGTPANARDLHNHLPGSRLHMLKGVGHFVIREAPEETARLMDAFLDGLQA